ncbi:GIY-YIG nuclease family protein [Lacibacterium aquatile]|uniref:GIY-YIG nuclease family protein n=1 Tax=Lacibacterium aquatile TaxID=1168082 RepID=A0ABW5DQI7_9PROT
MQYWVYILASGPRDTLYIGVTNDLLRRVWEHREGLTDGFTRRYAIKHLVWFEEHAEIAEAISREKRVKRWPRQWRYELVAKDNPQ